MNWYDAPPPRLPDHGENYHERPEDIGRPSQKDEGEDEWQTGC